MRRWPAILGASEGSLTGPRTGHHETRFRVGDDSGRWITVQRSADLLVVIRPDGEVVRFPLSPKVVRGFHKKCESGLTENLIADVGDFRYANSRAELQSFVSAPDRRRNGG